MKLWVCFQLLNKLEHIQTPILSATDLKRNFLKYCSRFYIICANYKEKYPRTLMDAVTLQAPLQKLHRLFHKHRKSILQYSRLNIQEGSIECHIKNTAAEFVNGVSWRENKLDLDYRKNRMVEVIPEHNSLGNSLAAGSKQAESCFCSQER